MKQCVLYRRNDHKKLLFYCLKYFLQLGTFYHLVNRPLRWIVEVRQGTLPLPAYPPSGIITELGLQLLQSCPSRQHIFTSCFHYAKGAFCVIVVALLLIIFLIQTFRPEGGPLFLLMVTFLLLQCGEGFLPLFFCFIGNVQRCWLTKT